MHRNTSYDVKRNHGFGDTRPRSELYPPQAPIITAAQSRLETPLFNPAGFPMLGSTISNSQTNNPSSMNKQSTASVYSMSPLGVNTIATPPTSIPGLLTPLENEVNKVLISIILTIHKRNEYASRERVQQELFAYFRVESWKHLGVYPQRFTVLNNLSDRQKGVTFYLQIFKHIFNLCTLHDLAIILARFLNVDKYEDLQLGPLSQRPEVQQLFNYRPVRLDQPIPPITTDHIIKRFIDFDTAHQRHGQTSLDLFLDHLAKSYGVQKVNELGLFYNSLPYLKQVTSAVLHGHQSHTQKVIVDTQEQLIEDVRARLNGIKEKLYNELEPSSLHSKKTPTAVFNYLISIVNKYFDFIPQQPVLYAILTQLRENELLKCLLNVTIYLGTINQPELYIAELKKLYNVQDDNPYTREQTIVQAKLILNATGRKKDRRKINSLYRRQQLRLQSLASNLMLSEQNTTVSPASASSTRYRTNSKPAVSFKELCSYIYNLLAGYDNVLTVEELFEVDKEVCAHHHVDTFSAFTYDENDDDPINLVSFLNKHRQIIDPHGNLAIYEHTTLRDDRVEIYSFVQQLNVINDDQTHEEHQEHLQLLRENTDQFHMSEEKLATIEKAIKHKFGGSITFRETKQIVKKVINRYPRNKYSIIRFEESLLDINGLNQLDICPTSVNIDETQLCHLILQCPLMTDLNTWLQWLYFFQPKYGTLKSFIAEREHNFKDLHLLETSTGELFRLPIDATLTTFEHELNAMQIRSAVGHLCALIIQQDLITRFSFNIYRISMETWFRQLRSLAMLQKDYIDPMQYILNFLSYLPILIGQHRIVEELVLVPLDAVFGNERENGTINARTKIWNLANVKQKTKLEFWGYMLTVTEWKNEKKWLGQEDLEEKFIQNENITKVDIPAFMPTATEPSVLPAPANIISDIPATTFTISSTDESVSVTTAFEHIESIRRLFGVKNELDPTSQSVVANYQNWVEGLLAIVSTGLYSDQGHFVLELIQNADDNQYTTNHLPTLRFILSSDRILVCNNEIGFQRENVSAICNVCASTKGKHKQGYVGHKGIGFKSVFLVSHRPEIHSGNYHFCFDTFGGTQLMGDMQPIWLDNSEELLPSSDEWTTCIRLPLKQDIQRDRLQRNFDDIQARFLLFLNRLRQIEIVNQQDNISSTNSPSRIFTRNDYAQGKLIELQEKTTNGSTTNSLWLIIKKVINVPEEIRLKLTDKKTDVDLTTTIAIAYPLSGIHDSSGQFSTTQPLFAHLPLRSYGFRFILQADFEVPANRKEVLHDHIWNDWLKSEMTCLLSLTYQELQSLPDLLASSLINTQANHQITPIEIIKYFLKLIPFRKEIDPYFSTFVDKSIQSLMGIIQLPISRQNEKNETIIDWIPPSKCVIVRDPFIRKILSQDLLLSHFNSYYVHEQLILECNEQVLVELGCRQLDISDILQLIEISYKQNEQVHLKTSLAIEQIAQWLVCLDYSLQQQQREEMYSGKREKETIAKLKQLKIIPLKEQTYLVSVDQFDKETISFPLDKSVALSRHLKIVLDDVPILDQHLLTFIEDKYPQRFDSIKKLLRKLGIAEAPNIRDIYRQHVLPVMSDPNRWAFKSESVLTAYLLFIYKDLYLPDRDNFESGFLQLQNKMIVKTRDNKFVSLGSPDTVVHLTSRYGCEMSLESLRLSKFKFTFISDDYYNQWHDEISNRSRRKDDRDNIDWFALFLRRLNLSDFLQMHSDSRTFDNVAQLAETQWAYLIQPLSKMIFESFIIQDYRCDEFDKLVSLTEDNQTADPELCVKLLQYMDNLHENISMYGYYVASMSLSRAHKFGHGAIKTIESSFCLSVRQHAWIPTNGNKLCKPGDVYLLSPDNETFAFQRYVPHVDLSKLSLKNKIFIYDILGIKSQVTHRTMFELLMKWSCDLDSKSLWTLVDETNTTDLIPCTLPDTFRQSYPETIENCRRIYQFLASNDEIRNLFNRFRLWPVIFIPRDQRNGDFLFVHQTFWNDPISLLSVQETITDSNGRIPIQLNYDNNPILKVFFLEILQVEFQPRIDDYLPLLSTVEDIDKVWKIIEIITKLAIEQNKQHEVREKCLDIAFIPCINHKQKAVKYTDHPLYPHDIEIGTLFADTLPIIQLPSSHISTEFKDKFCQLFSIKNLSEVIRTKVHVEKEQPSISIANFYRSTIDLIQQFLIENKLISDVRSVHLSSVFVHMQFLCVDRISLSYCYGPDIIKSVPTTYGLDSYIDEESSKFYIRKRFETSETRYIDTMVDFIVEDDIGRSKLSKNIKILLQTYQTDDAQGLDKLREILIETYEPKWTIEEEIQPDIPISSTTPEMVVKIDITQEEINEMEKQPSIRPERPPRKDPKKEPSHPLTSICGKRIDTDESNLIPSGKRSLKEQTKSISDDSTENEQTASNLHHRKYKHREQDKNENRSNEQTNDSNRDHFNEVRPSIDFTDFDSLPLVSFEHIPISTLTDLDLPSLASSIAELSVNNLFHKANSEVDIITGLKGEESVFHHLKSIYPEEDVEWINQDGETGRPYDICITFKSENNRKQFIEVKTTRLPGQNTFPLSINEVEYLLEHPSNYFIYRLYYTDEKNGSELTVISKIKDNLQKKHIKLSMTYALKPSE